MRGMMTPHPQTPFTLRAVLLALLFAGLGCWWVVENSLVRGGVQVGGSVPPIPAVAALLLLALANPLLRRWGLRRGEILLIYVFVAIAVSLPDVNVLTYLLAFLTVPHYFQTPENKFGGFLRHIPSWFAPQDAEVLRGFYEGIGEKQPVPWSAWLMPLLGWGVFLCAMWVTTFALLSLFRHRWIERERLPFPIVDLVMNLTPDSPPSQGGGGGGSFPPFLRDPVMWAGFALSAVYNVLNIANAFNPTVPATGRFFDLGALFTERPWTSLRPMWISFRPEIFGIGYLMSTDVLFTAWLTYLIMRAFNVLRTAIGYEVISTAYDYQEIAVGAYIGLMVVLVWMAFRAKGKGQETRDTSSSSLPDSSGLSTSRSVTSRFIGTLDKSERRSPLLALIGFAYMLWWTTRAGLSWWLGGLHLALLLSFALVYSRMRAETGAPLIYLFPFWQQQKMLLNFFGTSALGADGGASLTILASLGFLSRGNFPELAAFQMEAMDIGERAHIKPRHLTACVLAALPFGLLVGSYLFLTNCYRYGFNVLDAGTVQGGYRVYIATQQYRELVQWQTQPKPPDVSLIFQTLLGFGLTVGMVALRSVFLRFPLHPLGFAMVTSYGFHLWAPFMAVWACKLVIVKLGGARLYRRLIPLFLGIVLGHYLVAGVIWGGLSLYDAEIARRYVIHFA